MRTSLRVRVSRPILLVLVYGALAGIVTATAITQTILVSAHVSAATLSAVVESDSGTIALFLNSYVAPSDVEPGGLTAEARATLEERLAVLARRSGLLRVELRGLDGTILASDVPGLAGTKSRTTEAFTGATEGRTSAAIAERPEAVEAAGPALPAAAVLGEYLPIMNGGRARAVVGVWRDAAPILARLDAARRDVAFATLSAALIAAAVLYLLFRAAQTRLSRQATELVQSTRRDPLTGMLNHGSLVEIVTGKVDEARRSGEGVAVAHVDIDNFRLLGSSHGHAAGDRALLEVGTIIGEIATGSMTAGRFGPDEFLVIGDSLPELESLVAKLRVVLLERGLQFESTEHLPITVSAGLADFPENAGSVTALLSAVAQALDHAKASGGDGVRVFSAPANEDLATQTFSVLQGLVFAIDTKDRYTKRHSEEVARYGVFLADRLGLAGNVRSALWKAGLLHDIGKIGLPDPILRKPGPLTANEFEIVKQHVALGDSIARALPNFELARAGIRHHHERWDGSGYLERLAGNEIPLIARILAVGDAFSAMTTSRPYRKALSVEEALRRLGDSAGAAFDEHLVSEFIAAFEGAPDPPLPGQTGPAGAAWLSWDPAA